MTSTSPLVRARPVRRSPADLPFRFADRGLAQALAAERGEPAWLRKERLEAWKAFEALPVESNQLYTPYVDLRAAKLEGARPYVRTAVASAKSGEGVPDGVAAIIEIVEDGVGAIGLSQAAAKAGVTLETLGAALARDPKGVRADLEGGHSLPSGDKLAALARGFWSQGIRLVVPPRVRLAEPILIRWRSSRPERALITRTLVRLGDGAAASIVEEIEPSAPPVACAEGEEVPQGLFHGTTEVTLGPGRPARHRLHPGPADRARSRSCIAAPPSARAPRCTGRSPSSARGSSASRVDNRLEGDRSSVEQVEIVFGGDDQLFDLTSYTRHLGRDTTGNLLSKGALLDRARSYMKGLITIEKSAVGTDSFLGEFGMNLSKRGAGGRDPVARDRPARLPPGGPLVVGRPDRREPALLPRDAAASRPTRRASSSSSGSSSRSSPGSRSRRAQDRLRDAARGEVGGELGGRRGRPAGADGSVRRIDLVAVDDVPDGTMKMAWVDGTDQVLVVNLGGTFHAYQGICTHEYFELDKGFLDVAGGGGRTLTCALHLSRFDLADGEPLDPPAEDPLAIYPVVVEDGRVLIEVPDGPLEVNG